VQFISCVRSQHSHLMNDLVNMTKVSFESWLQVRRSRMYLPLLYQINMLIWSNKFWSMDWSYLPQFTIRHSTVNRIPDLGSKYSTPTWSTLILMADVEQIGKRKRERKLRVLRG